MCIDLGWDLCRGLGHWGRIHLVGPDLGISFIQKTSNVKMKESPQLVYSILILIYSGSI